MGQSEPIRRQTGEGDEHIGSYHGGVVQHCWEQPVAEQESPPWDYRGGFGVEGVEWVWQLAVLRVVDIVVVSGEERVKGRGRELLASRATHCVQFLEINKFYSEPVHY